jgi:hypothetical protein
MPPVKIGTDNNTLGLAPLAQPKNVDEATTGPQCAQHMNLDAQIAKCDRAASRLRTSRRPRFQ